MNIPYTLRSQFVAPCEKLIIAQKERLDSGEEITALLKAGGYAASLSIIIRPADPAEFEAEWTSSDPTRFPVRLRAVATALRNRGYTGRFAVSHLDGTLSIKRA